MRDETCKMLSQELIGEVDQDGNGCITFNEFVWLMTRSPSYILSTQLIVFIVTLGKYMTVKLRMKSEKHSGEIDKHYYVLVWHDKVEVSKDP